MDPEKLGRAEGAYEAYAKVTGNKNFRGDPMPKFDDLPEKIQEAWVAAAEFAYGAGRDDEAQQ